MRAHKLPLYDQGIKGHPTGNGRVTASGLPKHEQTAFPLSNAYLAGLEQQH